MTNDKFDTCPACDGTKEISIPKKEKNYSWNKGKTTKPCNNCGGQTMVGKALGIVLKDPATGKGCLHQYSGRLAGRCYTIYTCEKCKFTYEIDSSD